jgi:mono/diheme cytochrome c family protein
VAINIKWNIVLFVTILLLCAGITISARSPQQDSAASATKNGERIFKDSCASCHNAHSSDLLIGVGLKGYYKTHQPPPTDATVRKIIHDGKGTMPAFGNLEDAEIDNLIAYLKTL